MKYAGLFLASFLVSAASKADEIFVYVQPADAPPPRFVDIQRGLPGAFTRGELLERIAPRQGYLQFFRSNTKAIQMTGQVDNGCDRGGVE